MALFGCSPLLLSVIAERFFMHPDLIGVATLNVTQFLGFLAFVAGVAHLFGAIALPGHSGSSTSLPEEVIDVEPALVPERPSRSEGVIRPADSDSETSPLLSTRRPSLSPDESRLPKAVDVVVTEVIVPSKSLEVCDPQHGTTLELLKDPRFWALTTVVAILVGCVSQPSYLVRDQ